MGNIDRFRGLEPQGVLPDFRFQVRQFSGLFDGGHIAPAHERIHGLLVKTHHPVTIHIRFDGNVHEGDVLLVGTAAKHIDALADNVSQVVQGGVILIAGREVHADNIIGSHGAGQVGRVIVAHTAIDKHHAFRPHGREQPGDGHRGAQGRRNMPAVPDLGL